MNCYNCFFARQHGNKNNTKQVGCVLAEFHGVDFIYESGYNGNFYEGWFYAHRLPSDVSDDKSTVDRGILVNSYLVDSNKSCENYREQP